MCAFLTKFRSSKTKLHLTHFTSYLSQPYSPITYTYNRLSIDLSNQEINSIEYTAFLKILPLLIYGRAENLDNQVLDIRMSKVTIKQSRRRPK